MRCLAVGECSIVNGGYLSCAENDASSMGFNATPIALFSTINLTTTLTGATLSGMMSSGTSIATQAPYYLLANIGLGGILGAFLGTTLGIVSVLGYYYFEG